MEYSMKDLVKDIGDGHFDEHLTAINAMIESRRQTLAIREAASCSIGDSVVIQNCRPKYLQGCLAEVVSRKGATVTVKIPESNRWRGYSGRRIDLKPAMVKMVSTTLG